MTRERKRRQYGTGSIYRRAKDNRWCGTIDAGYTATGGRRRITVTGTSEAEVKARILTKRRELSRDQTAPATSRTTVKAWADTWLAMTQRTSRPATHTKERGAVRKWIVPAIGHRRLDQLTPADVRDVVNAVAGECSTTTAHAYHGVLVRMLKAAVAEGHPVSGRALAVKPPKLAVNDRQAIPLPDALAILAAASRLPHGSRWVAAFLQGMRQGECLGLTWDKVGPDSLAVSWQLQPLPYLDKADHAEGFRIPDGFEARQLDGRLHLVRPKSKAGWRVIPLIPQMAAALDHWRTLSPPSPHGLVWPAADGRPRTALDDRREWHGLQDAAGVQHPAGRHYHLHEARHTTATLLMSGDVPESVRIAIMGHSSIAVTRGYEHSDQTMALDALARIGGVLELG